MKARAKLLDRILQVYKEPLLEKMSNNKERRLLWLKELLKRMKCWADKVEPNVTGANSYMFDVMQRLDPSKMVEQEEIKSFFQKHNVNLTYLDVLLIAWLLNWLENRAYLEEELCSLPNPFEPFEILMELGGGYITRDGSGAFSAYNVAVHPSSIVSNKLT